MPSFADISDVDVDELMAPILEMMNSIDFDQLSPSKYGIAALAEPADYEETEITIEITASETDENMLCIGKSDLVKFLFVFVPPMMAMFLLSAMELRKRYLLTRTTEYVRLSDKLEGEYSHQETAVPNTCANVLLPSAILGILFFWFAAFVVVISSMAFS